MDRVMSVEDKIRRAEEIYQRRKQGELNPVSRANVNNKKEIKLIKKMIIQLIISVTLYLIIYIINNNKYVFSEDFINKANEILSYDTNFIELYNNVNNKISGFIKKEVNNDNSQESEQITEEKSKPDGEKIEENNEKKSDANGIGGAEGERQEKIEDKIDKQSLTQEEQDIEDIKNTTSFIKPIDGIITSRFGQRESATGTVPKNHTGVDISANIGTKIMSSTDGEVVLDSEEGDYRKTFENTNRKSEYYLCTL